MKSARKSERKSFIEKQAAQRGPCPDHLDEQKYGSGEAQEEGERGTDADPEETAVHGCGQHPERQGALDAEDRPVGLADSWGPLKFRDEKSGPYDVCHPEDRPGHEYGERGRQLQIGMKVPVEGGGEQSTAQLNDHEGAVYFLSGHHVEEEIHHDERNHDPHEDELDNHGFEEETDKGQRRQQAQPGGDGVVGAHVQVGVAALGGPIQGRQPENRIAGVEKLEDISRIFVVGIMFVGGERLGDEAVYVRDVGRGDHQDPALVGAQGQALDIPHQVLQ